jgi:hypothetical protein
MATRAPYRRFRRQFLRDVNEETHNHPFGDLYAELAREPFLIGVKTRNKYNDKGKLNGEYNVKKKGANVRSIGARYKADLGWIAIQVIPELQTFNAYFGTIAEIEEYGERFSIPMRPERTEKYMRLGREDEFDSSIRPEWSNGGYARYLEVPKHDVRKTKKIEPTASRHSGIKESDKTSRADITSTLDDVGVEQRILDFCKSCTGKRSISHRKHVTARTTAHVLSCLARFFREWGKCRVSHAHQVDVASVAVTPWRLVR